MSIRVSDLALYEDQIKPQKRISSIVIKSGVTFII